MSFCEEHCRKYLMLDGADPEADSTMQAISTVADLMMRSVLRTINSLGLFLLLILMFHAKAASAQSAVQTVQSGRERLSLDRGWLFHDGDIPFPVITGHQPSYDNAKAGSSSGAASPDYDDSSWRQVNVPHDWAVWQPFDKDANIAQGYRQRGMGWYRRYFRLDQADRGKHLEIQLDGIATHSTIWINGVLSARNWSGYNSIYIDMTPFARFGSELNVISVQVDANAMEGWWYEGAGMYRHTWLVKRNPLHIETDGVFANPVKNADGSWSIPVETTLYSMEQKTSTVQVESTLIDPEGKPVVSGHTEATTQPLGESIAKFTLPVSLPRLWSADQPTCIPCAPWSNEMGSFWMNLQPTMVFAPSASIQTRVSF
jgi:beta-galactosidase